MKKALVDAFLGFDKTLTEPEIVKKLKKMAADDYESVEEEEDEEVFEFTNNLFYNSSTICVLLLKRGCKYCTH